MFTIPQFSDIQKRAAYIVLATSIVVGSLFFTLSQGKASVPKPMVSLAPMAAMPSAPATIVVDVSAKFYIQGFIHCLRDLALSMRSKQPETS